MEKLTISRVGQVKDIQTKFGMKKKTGVQFKEYGEVWHDIWSGDLKVGQVVEGTRDSREYQGKTYWDFKFPKKDDKVNAEMGSLSIKVGGVIARLSVIEKHLGIKSVEDYKNLGNTTAKTNEEHDAIEYPDEEINAEDIPF